MFECCSGVVIGQRSPGADTGDGIREIGDGGDGADEAGCGEGAVVAD